MMDQALDQLLLDMSKEQLLEVVDYLGSKSLGLKALYAREAGEGAEDELKNDMQATSGRSKKAIVEELLQIIRSYPTTALWIKNQFVAQDKENVVGYFQQYLPRLQKAMIEKEEKSTNLYFFLDLAIQQFQQQNFDEGIALSSMLLFHMLTSENVYLTGDIAKIEGHIFELFEQTATYLKDFPEDRSKLYQGLHGMVTRLDSPTANAYKQKMLDLVKILK
ncbi:MAG: hypothetical protein FWF59_03820 [Turicibacter sp.]|nr:hypothetical protein [Turicibacter sp.]